MRAAMSVLCGVGLVAGCSASPASQNDAVDVASTNEALSVCGPRPTRSPPPCNSWLCTPSTGWEVWPLASGTACRSPYGPGTCDGGQVDWGTGQTIVPGACQPLPVSGVVMPKLYPLTLVYAPPGTASGKAGSASSVTYSAGSSLGTSTKTTHTFKEDTSVTAEATLGGFANLGQDKGWSVTKGDQTTLELKKSLTTTIIVQGAIDEDGIDHDLDIFYLWLKPQLDLAAQGNAVSWSLSIANSGTTMDIQYVYLFELKDPSKMRSDVAARLAYYGVTSDDLASLIPLDPFANGSMAIDRTRYMPTPTTAPYEPPPRPGVAPATFQIRMDNSTVNTAEETYTSDTSVSDSVGVDIKFTNWLGLKAKFSDKVTWTNSSVDATSTGTTQSALAVVTGPSFGYQGPPDLQVYYDSLFGTFLFVPITGAVPSLSGTVVDGGGQPLAGQPVDLTLADGRVLHTFTGPQGDYRIFSAPSGTATLTAGGASVVVTIGATPATQDLAAANPISSTPAR